MKILVIRFSSIGDIVLTSPLIRSLKGQIPDCEIHFLTKKSFADLVRFNPCVDQVHVLDDSLTTVIQSMRKIGFDHILDLHNNIRSTRVIRSLKRPYSRVNKENRRKWLMVNLKQFAPDGIPHIVDRYVDTAEVLNVRSDGNALELHIPAEERISINELPKTHQSGFVAFAIGGAQLTKRLPTHHMITLCSMIDKPIVLIGGPTDTAVAGQIQNGVGAKVHDTTGKLSILQSSSLIEQADCVITHDSSALHIGCAVGTPTISIWGNTVPELGFAPYEPNDANKHVIHEVAELSCRPCSKLGKSQCPKGHFRCMEMQDLKQIAISVNELTSEFQAQG